MSFTVGEGWSALVLGEPGSEQTQEAAFFALFNKDAPAWNVAFISPTRVIDPNSEWDDAGNLIPVPSDLVDWMPTHPKHEAGDLMSTTVGGLDAKAVDIVVADAPKNSWPSCGGPCVMWFPIAVDHEDGPLKAEGMSFPVARSVSTTASSSSRSTVSSS